MLISCIKKIYKFFKNGKYIKDKFMYIDSRNYRLYNGSRNLVRVGLFISEF